MKKAVSIILSVMMLTMLCMGCSGKTSTSQTLFSVGDYKVSVNEFNNYLVQTLSCYQVQSAEMDDEIKNTFIDDTLNEIRMQIAIEKMANEVGTELTDEEYNEHVTQNTEMFVTYYGDNVLKEFNIDRELAEKYFLRTALVSKYESTVEKSYYEEYKNQLTTELKPEQFCSFDVIEFDSEDSANKFRNSVDDTTSYQDILSKLSEYNDYTMTSDKGVYGGFDQAVNSAVEGLKDGKLSKVFTLNGKSTIVLMQKSVDEEFYNQTIIYIASESAKSSFVEDVNRFMEENNIVASTIDDSMKELIDPSKIYESLCKVEAAR